MSRTTAAKFGPVGTCDDCHRPAYSLTIGTKFGRPDVRICERCYSKYRQAAKPKSQKAAENRSRYLRIIARQKAASLVAEEDDNPLDPREDPPEVIAELSVRIAQAHAETRASGSKYNQLPRYAPDRDPASPPPIADWIREWKTLRRRHKSFPTLECLKASLSKVRGITDYSAQTMKRVRAKCKGGSA